MKKIIFLNLLAVCVFKTFLAFAVEFVQAPALTQAVTTPVKACTVVKPVQLPVITWGGDIATIFANGNDALTSKGSLFDKKGLQFKIKREDVFTNQLSSYLSCESPFLRGTMGMLAMSSGVTEKDPRTKLKILYQLTWSAGGDAMVVKDGIKSPADLKGKTIALQAYGPHVDYLGKVLADAGLTFKDVTVKWVKDLTGTANTPMAAFQQSGIDAALVIIPDALALTSGGAVGTGSEDSVKGATILLSTKTANRIIADVYAVRADYYEKNKDELQKFVHALLLAEQDVKALFKEKNKPEFQTAMRGSAKVLLDSEQAAKDAEALYGDAEFAGWKGNVAFFADAKYPRGLGMLADEIQTSFLGLGLITAKASLDQAGWDYNLLKEGMADTSGVIVPKFDTAKVMNVVTQKQQQGTLSDGSLFSFEVYFQPNQNSFSADLYKDAFKKVVDLASTYGGAIITIEGHSDPMGYLTKKKAGETQVVLSRIRQSAKNLSLTRAIAVRDSLIGFSTGQGINLDPSQFAVVGQGIERPKSGVCGEDPCAPKTNQEWLNNMRVEFRIIQVEAESNVFNPL